ncbi:hypothetical protein XELAEV_18026517mg [Xenopus laevis]|uniref:Reverse transcriptase zinc-binding domain-containing protein n=1 Tax=Xenopus laevis TaxID=8355 RepID=A0A974CUM4_XENLA|nr:hypothetical protein XELAEV_18026517mg [Xenopus laevis]
MVKYISLCIKTSRKENIAGCMVRYVDGNVLRRYGLCVMDLRKPMCFNLPWFYVRIGRFIRRNNLENANVNEWFESQKIREIFCRKEEMEAVDGLNVSESKEVWKKVCSKDLINRQKDLAWMCAHGCLPTRVFQRRKRLVNSEKCPRECCNSSENIIDVLWECYYAKTIWGRMGKLIKGLTGIELLTYNMMLFGLCGLTEEKARVLWIIVNCIKEVLWDIRNMCIFRNCEIDEDGCVALIRNRIFLYVLCDRKKYGIDAEGIWKYRKWKFCFFSSLRK